MDVQWMASPMTYDGLLLPGPGLFGSTRAETIGVEVGASEYAVSPPTPGLAGPRGLAPSS